MQTTMLLLEILDRFAWSVMLMVLLATGAELLTAMILDWIDGRRRCATRDGKSAPASTTSNVETRRGG